uniref:C-type lectin domain-containing protein n=1 Tax=Leptobrachium leishanense TaxID=445787 RepID=A0A8C5QKF4_9ANUR
MKHIYGNVDTGGDEDQSMSSFQMQKRETGPAARRKTNEHIAVPSHEQKKPKQRRVTVLMVLQIIMLVFLIILSGLFLWFSTFCTSCPTGWRFIGSSCYFFSTSEKKWEEGRDDCVRHNSRLLIFNDKQEVDNLLPYYKEERYWIGLRKDGKNEWKWLDGTALGYENWGSGEPNNNEGKENCTEIRETFWNDVSCDSSVLYICEAVWRC